MSSCSSVSALSSSSCAAAPQEMPSWQTKREAIVRQIEIANVHLVDMAPIYRDFDALKLTMSDLKVVRQDSDEYFFINFGLYSLSRNIERATTLQGQMVAHEGRNLPVDYNETEKAIQKALQDERPDAEIVRLIKASGANTITGNLIDFALQQRCSKNVMEALINRFAENEDTGYYNASSLANEILTPVEYGLLQLCRDGGGQRDRVEYPAAKLIEALSRNNKVKIGNIDNLFIYRASKEFILQVIPFARPLTGKVVRHALDENYTEQVVLAVIEATEAEELNRASVLDHALFDEKSITVIEALLAKPGIRTGLTEIERVIRQYPREMVTSAVDVFSPSDIEQCEFAEKCDKYERVIRFLLAGRFPDAFLQKLLDKEPRVQAHFSQKINELRQIEQMSNSDCVIC